MTTKARILIVDDSRCFRTALQEALAGLEDIVVIGSVWSGQKALEFIQTTPPDIVLLDLAMPGMDGVQTLQAINQWNASRPGTRLIGVIVVSAYLDTREKSVAQAKQEGALAIIPKPSGPNAPDNLSRLRQVLSDIIRQYCGTRRTTPVVQQPVPPKHSPTLTGLRNYKAVLIAISTGGPEALKTLLPELCERIEQPILIVQHIMAGMMTGLVQTLAIKCPWPVREALSGTLIQPQHIYFAPTGHHLVLRHDSQGNVIARLTDQPDDGSFRPSADVLFRSAAHVWGGDVLALVMTGMLNDGTAGLQPLKRAGAYVIAQDQASSVVWGMPGSAVAAGLVDEVVPLDRLAIAVGSVLHRGKKE